MSCGNAYVGEGVDAVIDMEMDESVGYGVIGDKGKADGQDAPAAAGRDYFGDLGTSGGIRAGDGADETVDVMDGGGDVQDWGFLELVDEDVVKVKFCRSGF